MNFSEAVEILNSTYRAALVKEGDTLILKRSGYEDKVVDFPPMGLSTLKRVHYACNVTTYQRIAA